MGITTSVSWLQFSTIWTNTWCCSLPSASRLTTTLMCHDIPLFPNQSVWVSLYFCGKNFIAQSWVIKTEFSSSLARISVWALSCWMERSWCCFHASIAAIDCWQVNITSSRSSSGSFSAELFTNDFMEARVDFSCSQDEQEWSWRWLHLEEKRGCFWSLKACTQQWSGTFDASETCTCKNIWTRSFY